MVPIKFPIQGQPDTLNAGRPLGIAKILDQVIDIEPHSHGAGTTFVKIE
jgi:hypothetical protein